MILNKLRQRINDLIIYTLANQKLNKVNFFFNNKNKLRIKFLLWLAFFLTISIINRDYIFQSPIWDTAGGLFAPAEYLYRTNFDLYALLKEEGFSKGGPNVHVYNIMTFITACIMWLFDGDPELIYISLHMVQFAIAASILYLTFFLILPIFGPLISVLMVISIFVFPPFLVQTRYMYVELAGALFLFYSYSTWVRGNYKIACVCAVGACAIKSFGLALVLAMIILIGLDKGRSLKLRAILVSAMLMSGLGIELLRWSQGTNMINKMTNDYSSYFFNSFLPRLQTTPDLFIFLTFILYSGVFCVLTGKLSWKSDFLNTIQPIDIHNQNKRMIIGGFLIVGSFLGFIITVPLAGVVIYPLTRYYMWIWPLVIPTLFCIVFIFNQKIVNPKNILKKHSLTFISLILICFIFYFLANYNGKYYPEYQKGTLSFSSVERSTEYESFNKMQRELLYSASEIDQIPVYLNLFDYYYTSSVLMGYVDNKKENFKNIITSFDNPSDINLYPDKFILVYSNVSHGGSSMRDLRSSAIKSSQYNIETIYQANVDGYKGFIDKIVRINKWKH